MQGLGRRFQLRAEFDAFELNLAGFPVPLTP
jgi:hypothetical protein